MDMRCAVVLHGATTNGITLNQRVQGSSPCAPTTNIKNGRAIAWGAFANVLFETRDVRATSSVRFLFAGHAHDIDGGRAQRLAIEGWIVGFAAGYRVARRITRAPG